MKIVLDTNILLIAIGRKSKYRPIWEAFISGDFQIVVSEDIIYEYEEILKAHAAPGVAEIVSDIFVESPDVIYQHVYYNWNAIDADRDDNKFFDIAVAANADFLVTNDRHFDIVKNIPFPKVTIVTAQEFLNELLK